MAVHACTAFAGDHARGTAAEYEATHAFAEGSP